MRVSEHNGKSYVWMVKQIPPQKNSISRSRKDIHMTRLQGPGMNSIIYDREIEI